jgi:hypothetical protein
MWSSRYRRADHDAAKTTMFTTYLVRGLRTVAIFAINRYVLLISRIDMLPAAR